MKTVIEDITFALPERLVDNLDLARENPNWILFSWTAYRCGASVYCAGRQRPWIWP